MYSAFGALLLADPLPTSSEDLFTQLDSLADPELSSLIAIYKSEPVGLYRYRFRLTLVELLLDRNELEMAKRLHETSQSQIAMPILNERLQIAKALYFNSTEPDRIKEVIAKLESILSAKLKDVAKDSFNGSVESGVEAKLAYQLGPGTPVEYIQRERERRYDSFTEDIAYTLKGTQAAAATLLAQIHARNNNTEELIRLLNNYRDQPHVEEIISKILMRKIKSEQ